MVRLQKFLADAGVASRRACEQFILAGRVAVNGRRISELGTRVDSAHDRVMLDGAPVKAKRKMYVALNKPRGYLCSRTDQSNRRCAGDLLPKEWSNLYSVGRLDYDSEGLIFFTNDGEFCLHLTHPRHGVRKKYRVTVEGRLDPAMLGKLKRGVVSAGEQLKADRVRLIAANSSHSVAEIELLEGRNREIRRMVESLGLKVTQLRRTQIGRIRLGELPAGKWRTLNAAEVTSLLSNPLPGSGSQTQEH